MEECGRRGGGRRIVRRERAADWEREEGGGGRGEGEGEGEGQGKGVQGGRRKKEDERREWEGG